MKKITILVTVILAAILLTACSNGVVGEWKIYIDPMEIEDLDANDTVSQAVYAGMMKATLEFKKDGTVELISDGTVVESNTYAVDGKNILIYDGDELTNQLVLDGNELTENGEIAFYRE